MVFSSISVFMLPEQAPRNDCHWDRCFQKESLLPPGFQEGSPMPENGSDPGLFQPVELGACEIFLVPFRSRVMVSYHLLALLNACPTGLQSLTFWGLTLLVLDLWAGEPSVSLDPSLLRVLHCDYPPIGQSPLPGAWVLTTPCLSLLLLPILCWSSFMSLAVENIFW